MPNSGSSETVVLRTPLGNLFSIQRFIPSLTFTSRKHSSRGDDNLEDAELYLQVTDKQLDIIYKASQQASETYAGEITEIQDQFNEITSLLNAAKKVRGGQSAFKQTLRRLSNDAGTKDLLVAARRLSQKAKHTSARVTSDDSSDTVLQTASSSEYPVVPREQVDNELKAQTNINGINFSFDRKATAYDAKKIEAFVGLCGEEWNSEDGNIEESESGATFYYYSGKYESALLTSVVVRALRSRKSDLSTYSFHYWGPDAYNTGESNRPSGDTSSQRSAQSRTSSGMQLGAHAVFNHCRFNVNSMQSNDRSTISDATSNLGVSVVGRDTPLQLSAVHVSARPSCGGPRGAEVQTGDISSPDAAVEDIQSVPERWSSAASSQANTSNPAVKMSTLLDSDPDQGDIQQASPVTAADTTNISSHSLIANGSSVVSFATMNFESPGATGTST
ncbi:hypothetical protein AZE42_13232, partial [Rhizopogon vesiculosus]